MPLALKFRFLWIQLTSDAFESSRKMSVIEIFQQVIAPAAGLGGSEELKQNVAIVASVP
jgi:hypothetical protein